MTRPVVFERIILLDIETDPKNKQVGAYSVVHVPTSEVYHGSTDDIHRRIKEHEGDLRRGTHVNERLQCLANENPQFKLEFFPAENREDASNVEQRLIDSTPKEKLINSSLDTQNTMRGLWKNPDVAGAFKEARKGNLNALGSKHTDEWRERQAEQMKGNQHLAGHEHSEETRMKMSKAHKGVKKSENAVANAAVGRTKKNIIVDGTSYLNSATAAQSLGLSRTGVEKRCKSEKFPNYKFSEKKE